MTFRRILLLGALAFCSLLAAGVSARADFTFSTTSGGSIPFGTASNLIGTGQPVSQSLNGTQIINIEDIEISTTKVAPPTDTGTPAFSFTLNLTQSIGSGSTSAGTGSTTVSGSISVARSDIGGEVSSLVSATTSGPPTIVIGNTTYSFGPYTYTSPTVNSAPASAGAGNISVLITPVTTSAVPEPTSMILMGTGLAGVVGLGLRRIKKS